MNERSVSAAAILGFTLAIGLAVSGYIIGDSLYRARAAERYVEVKGLAERTVDANLVIWPLTVNVGDNDLSRLYGKLEDQRNTIRAFLEREGFEQAEISDRPPRVTDTRAEMYGAPNREVSRYLAEATILLRTDKVGKVRAAMEKASELVKLGVVLSSGDYSTSTDFQFTGLNEVKPDMIAEATRNARAAAEQFATDSGSKVGGIRSARQGLFTIDDVDRNTPYRKNVRVVTSVQYFLVD